MTRAEFRREELSRLVSLYGEYSIGRHEAERGLAFTQVDDFKRQFAESVEVYASGLVSLLDKIVETANFGRVD